MKNRNPLPPQLLLPLLLQRLHQLPAFLLRFRQYPLLLLLPLPHLPLPHRLLLHQRLLHQRLCRLLHLHLLLHLLLRPALPRRLHLLLRADYNSPAESMSQKKETQSR
jgi:hypothetical protein